ncbi:T cell receptor alpha chain MC.7.G5-like, partial [Heptranchias perlo]|uniref:T cell receptor alpha chain MC.7.G5-like n=1 Tax=Heptranchias perlo TaxID=212740 RepID=UPI00355A7E17
KRCHCGEYRWKYYDVDGPGTVVTVTADSSLSVSQRLPRQTSTAGDTVTISCEYSGLCPYTVHWYSQCPGQAPKYLLQRHTSGAGNNKNAAGGRISASIDPVKKISRLIISKLQLSDSAVYHCALRYWDTISKLIFRSGTRIIIDPVRFSNNVSSFCCDDVELDLVALCGFFAGYLSLCGLGYTAKLTFGNGTEVIVEPKEKTPKEPTVSVFYPPVIQRGDGESTDKVAVCLVSEFSPKEIGLFINTTTVPKINVTRSSHLLNNGYYRSSGFLSLNSSKHSVNVTCEARHMARSFYSKRDSLYCAADLPRVNFLSLTVMGLRILFLKCVAFNVLLTARVWLL